MNLEAVKLTFTVTKCVVFKEHTADLQKAI